MEPTFKETKELYYEIRKMADTSFLYREIGLLESQITEKEHLLKVAPNRQIYKEIQGEIAKLVDEVLDREIGIRQSETQRKNFFLDEEREKMKAVYNKEITPLIKRYAILSEGLEKAIFAFEKAAEEIANEMLEIENEVVKVAEIRMKIGDAKVLRPRKNNHYAETLTRGSRAVHHTFPGVVLTKLSDLKAFTQNPM